MRVKASDYASGAYGNARILGEGVAGHIQKQINQEKIATEAAGPVGRAAFGALDEVSLGLPTDLSVALLSATGDQEGAQLARDISGGTHATTAGQIGGAIGLIAPAMLGGEAGLLAKTPMGITGRMGTAAERFAGRIIGETPGLLGSAAKPIIQSAARFGTEGAVLGLANQVQHNVIDNVPLTVSAMVSGVEDGALLGFLAGGALGGAGAAARGAGRAGLKMAEVMGGGAEEVVANRIGLSDLQKEAIARRGGNVREFLTKSREGLESQGLSWESKTTDIASGSQKAAAHYQAIRDGALADLDREAVGAAPSVDRIRARAMAEIAEPYAGTPYYSTAKKAVNKVTGAMFKDVPFLVNAEQKMATWESLAKTRDLLSTKYDSIVTSGGRDASHVMGKGDVYRKLIGIIDSEMATSMQGAEAQYGLSGIADKYRSATVMKGIMEETAYVASKTAAGEASSKGMGDLLSGQNLATMAIGAATGHSLIGAGVVAAKRLAKDAIGGYITPKIAEMAHRSMTIGDAASKTELLKGRIAQTLDRFFDTTGTGVTGLAVKATGGKPPKLTMDAFEADVERTREMLGEIHARRVQDYAMSTASIHPDMPKAIMEQYARARAYVQHNIPAGRKARQAASLGKVPQLKAPTLKDFSYKRAKKMLNPTSLLDEMDNGSVSKDQVDALKAFHPAMHAEIVKAAAFKIAEAKEKGIVLPADKVTQLGIVLGYPIDRKLEPEFVAAVQASYKTPPPDQNAPPAAGPINTQSLMTPVDKAIT